MLGYQIEKFGDIDGVVRAELPDPRPLGRHDVRVRLRACALNYRDLRVLTYAYGGAAQPGLIPLSAASGEVVETGSDAWNVAVGDRVALTFNPDWDGGDWSLTPGVAGRGGVINGVLREEIVVDHREAVPLAGQFVARHRAGDRGRRRNERRNVPRPRAAAGHGGRHPRGGRLTPEPPAVFRPRKLGADDAVEPNQRLFSILTTRVGSGFRSAPVAVDSRTSDSGERQRDPVAKSCAGQPSGRLRGLRASDRMRS
jgi:Alcohol dehydrogenase GroES-like domain